MVEVEATFDPTKGERRLLFDNSAAVGIVLDVRNEVLRLLAAAPIRGGRVQSLRLTERSVQMGLTNCEHSDIVAGLTGGERIVTALDRAGAKAGAGALVDHRFRRQVSR